MAIGSYTDVIRPPSSHLTTHRQASTEDDGPWVVGEAPDFSADIWKVNSDIWEPGSPGFVTVRCWLEFFFFPGLFGFQFVVVLQGVGMESGVLR